jgi:hypothetical protein
MQLLPMDASFISYCNITGLVVDLVTQCSKSGTSCSSLLDDSLAIMLYGIHYEVLGVGD